GADHVDQYPDADAEHQAAAIAGGAGYGVGDNEEGAEHGGAGQQVEQWRAVGIRAAAIPEQQAHDEQGGKHAHRRVPGDQALVQQVQAAGEKRQVDRLAAGTAEMAEGRVAGVQFIDGQALVDLQRVQGSGLGPAVGQAGNPEDVLDAV